MLKPLLTLLLAFPAAAYSEPTLEEKLSQLIMVAIDASEAPKIKEAVESGLGGVQLQWGSYSLENTRALNADLQAWAAASRQKTPLFIGTDYEGGSVYVPTTLGLLELPTNMMLGAAADENETASLFYLAGKELRRAGINMALGPVLDVNTNPENPIIGIRSFGSDPALVGRIGTAVLNGFRAAGVITVPKHFPGHGATDADSHKETPRVSLMAKSIRAEHLPPFAAAAKLGAPAIMTAHILYPSLDPDNPATFSQKILGGLLRSELGFKGMAVTDSLDMKGAGGPAAVPASAVAAVKAGADLLLVGKTDFWEVRNALFRAVRGGQLSRERVNEAYARVIWAKERAGLARPQDYTSDFDKAYLELSNGLAAKAVTLVHDRAGLIPLKDRAKKVGVFLFMPPRFNENALGLYRALKASGFSTLQYTFEIGPDQTDFSRLVEYAQKADILVIGSFQWARAQNRNQAAAIRRLLALGRPSAVLSLMSPYDLVNFPEAGAAMALYGATAPAMEAAGRILTGELTPTGKLPVALPAAENP